MRPGNFLILCIAAVFLTTGRSYAETRTTDLRRMPLPERNPAETSVAEQTILSVSHTAFGADGLRISDIIQEDTVEYTSRIGNFGFGVRTSYLYPPAAAPGTDGTGAEAALNTSFNFLSGYDFRGIAAGLTLSAAKGSCTGQDDSGTVIRISADAGLLTRFNLLKMYNSRQTNMTAGVTARNIGALIYGKASGERRVAVAPSRFSAEVSYRFIRTAGINAALTVPVAEGWDYAAAPEVEAGIFWEPADGSRISAAFFFSGGSPYVSISGGFRFRDAGAWAEFMLAPAEKNPLGKISLCARIFLGDRGKSAAERETASLYRKGLEFYAAGEWEAAIESWSRILELNGRYEPAEDGIRSARRQLELARRISSSLNFD